MTKQRTKTRPNELDGYWELIHGFPLRPIRTEKELDRAIEVIDALLDRADLTAAEEDYLDLLGDLVEQYEDEAHPLPDVSDGAMLRFLIDQKDVVQADVARATGIAESRISEVLSGKRQLTRAHIMKLAAYFHVQPAVFLSEEKSPNGKARLQGKR